MIRSSRDRLSSLVSVVATLGAAASAHSQVLGGGGAEPGVSTVRVILALLFCLALAVAGAVAIRYRTGLPVKLQLLGSRGDRRLLLVETLRVNPQVQLCIVACDDQELLLAATSQGAQLLKRLGEAPPGAERSGDGSS